MTQNRRRHLHKYDDASMHIRDKAESHQSARDTINSRLVQIGSVVFLVPVLWFEALWRSGENARL